MAEILASLDDINAELPSDDTAPDYAVVVADDDNTGLIQIAIARTIRGYLSRVIDNSILQSWTVPTNTPEVINVIAGKLIAAQLYFNQTAKTTTQIDDKSFAQKKYDEAIAMLNQIIAGTIILPGTVTTDIGSLGTEDFFPTDATDRAFTLSQQF